MNENQIEEAINRAQHGIKQYIAIMRAFSQINVARDKNFQKKFNAFYRIRGRQPEWYQTFYNYMENLKGHAVTFSEVLRYFKNHLNKYEPSFSSKLVATHDPDMPIWDKWVLKNIGLLSPYYNSPTKYEKAESIYKEIQNWFAKYETLYEGVMIIRKFDELVTAHMYISNTKKIDFVLWQTRDPN
jgi:hypothetical protein